MISRRTLLVVAVTVLALTTSIAFASSRPQQSPKAKTLAKRPAAIQAYPGLPVRLRIQAIGVDAPVDYVGKTPQGNMDVPNDPAKVGWYKFSVLPGEVGTAVIAGHVVGPRGEPAIFADISRLKAGDSFLITDAKGLSTSFIVSRTKAYDESAEPPEVFNSSGGAHLNLITCAGDWDQTNHRYLERLVVFADKSL